MVKKSKSSNSNTPLSKIAKEVFSPDGKNPYYKGDIEICNFEDLKHNIGLFSEEEAVWVSEWVHYLGDKKCASDIMKSPKKMKKTVNARYKSLKKAQ